MHFVLLLLEMLLDRLIPTWRDGLTMAIRPDGRIEHIPTRPGWWARCVSWFSGDATPNWPSRGKVRAARASHKLPPNMNDGPQGIAPDVS